jgi:hypothetical protein
VNSKRVLGKMPSLAYREWITTRADALGEIERAHAAVGGTGRRRRYATQQINQAYDVMLASQFQGYFDSIGSVGGVPIASVSHNHSMRSCASTCSA